MSDKTKVITGKVRFCYTHVWEMAKSENGRECFSVSILIPKDDEETLAKINSAVNAAYDEGLDKLKGKGKTAPAFETIKMPLRDGDTKENDEEGVYSNTWYLTATSTYAPGIIDADRSYITDHDEFYSGCYGRASINFYAYNSNGNKGIACGLRHLQKLEDGEKLGSASSALDDFAD